MKVLLLILICGALNFAYACDNNYYVYFYNGATGNPVTITDAKLSTDSSFIMYNSGDNWCGIGPQNSLHDTRPNAINIMASFSAENNSMEGIYWLAEQEFAPSIVYNTEFFINNYNLGNDPSSVYFVAMLDIQFQLPIGSNYDELDTFSCQHVPVTIAPSLGSNRWGVFGNNESSALTPEEADAGNNVAGIFSMYIDENNYGVYNTATLNCTNLTNTESGMVNAVFQVKPDPSSDDHFFITYID